MPRASLHPVPQFAANLTRYREAAGLTQAELARTVGITPAHLWKLERKLINPDLGLAVALAAALKIRVEKFLENKSK